MAKNRPIIGQQINPKDIEAADLPDGIADQFTDAKEQIKVKEDLTDLGFRPPAAGLESEVQAPLTQTQTQVGDIAVQEIVEVEEFVDIPEAPPEATGFEAVTPEQRANAISYLAAFGVDGTGMTDQELRTALENAGYEASMGGETAGDFTAAPTAGARDFAGDVVEAGGSFRVNADGSITLYNANNEEIAVIPQGANTAPVTVDENGNLVPTPPSNTTPKDGEGDPDGDPNKDDDNKDGDPDKDDEPETPEEEKDEAPAPEAPAPEEPDPETPEADGTPNPDNVAVDAKARQEFLDSRLGREQRKQDEEAADQASSGGVTDPSDESGGSGGGTTIDPVTGTTGPGPVRPPGGGDPAIDDEGGLAVTPFDLENLDLLAGGGPAADPAGPDGVIGVRPVVPQDPHSPVPSTPVVAPGVRGDVAAKVDDNLASASESFGAGSGSGASRGVDAAGGKDAAGSGESFGGRGDSAATVAMPDQSVDAPATVADSDIADVNLDAADVQVADLDTDALDGV